MGHQYDAQPKLFYHSFTLDDRIPATSVLRKIRKHIDFEFIYQEVKDCYGEKGNVSVPPPVILKMMLLLILYNVRSERELMNTLPMRLDWLLFLDYDLDSEIPNHSVLSKARNRWAWRLFSAFLNGSSGNALRRDWWMVPKYLWIPALSKPMPPTTLSSM